MRTSIAADRLLRRVAELDGASGNFVPANRAQSGQSNYTPQESSFIPVARVTTPITGAKPFYVGLFTSTAAAGSGMWRRYLRGYEGSSSLHLMPWYSWHLHPRHDARLYEVRDATAWVRLITTYPRVANGFVHPHWRTIAEHWDAVHISLRAIAAAQGNFSLPYSGPRPRRTGTLNRRLAALVLYHCVPRP